MNNIKEENLKLLEKVLQNKIEQKKILERKIDNLSIQKDNPSKRIEMHQKQIQSYGKKSPIAERKLSDSNVPSGEEQPRVTSFFG